jgi:hypothetical protein
MKIVPSFMPKRIAVGKAIILAACLTLWGCAAGSSGELRYTNEVTHMFQNHSISPAYNYYIAGPPQAPRAIIGLKPQYQLVNKLWQPVKPNTADLDILHRPRPRRYWHSNQTPRGAWVIDQQGNQIGIWYSMYPSTSISVSKDRRVTVCSPYLP